MGTTVQIVAATKWRNQRLDIGKTTGTLGLAAYPGQLKRCKRWEGIWIAPVMRHSETNHTHPLAGYPA